MESPSDQRVRRDFRSLPAAHDVLADPAFVAAADGLAPAYRTTIVRDVLREARAELASTGGCADVAAIRERAVTAARQLMTPKLGRVINATGVILHTNLGRAPISADAAAAMAEAAAFSVPLEMAVETGARGGRMAELDALLRALTGCEAALVVNNNAAATLLVLAAVLAPGRDAVILSRAEAVEIGGSFRIPDILRESGATLVDIGTTNRTYLHDYRDALSERTAALLKVHTSNFRLSGFVHQVPAADLVPLANEAGIPVIDDLGSGALVDTTRYGLAPEPTLPASVAGGAHLICASGDKLLGGPQAGIILGTRSWVARCAAHPLARAFRSDKATLAGLAATLRHYLREDYARAVPVWRMIAAPPDDLRARCRTMRESLAASGIVAAVAECAATIGGGSLPGETLPSFAVTITETAARHAGGNLDRLARALRLGAPPVIARLDNGRLWLDARTIFPEDDALLVSAVQAAWWGMTVPDAQARGD